MGTGMIIWEWEGNGNKNVIPAHLYLAAVCFRVCCIWQCSCRRCGSWRRCRCRQLRRVVLLATVAVLSTTVVIRSYNHGTTTFWCFVFHTLNAAQSDVSSYLDLYDSLIGSRPSDHYFRSVCLSVCLCRVFLSRLCSDFDQTRTHVICLGLLVSPRI